jgi:hypothetical protein
VAILSQILPKRPAPHRRHGRSKKFRDVLATLIKPGYRREVTSAIAVSRLPADKMAMPQTVSEIPLLRPQGAALASPLRLFRMLH